MTRKLPFASVSYAIQNELGLEYGTEEFREVFFYVMKYCLKCYSSIKYFHGDVKACWDFRDLNTTPACFRKRLCRTSAFAFEMKYFLLNLLTIRGFSGALAQDLCGQFGMFRCDATMAHSILKKASLRRELKRESKILAETPKRLYSKEAFRNAGKRFLEMNGDLMKFAQMRVRTKMRWILTSHNMSVHELSRDLLADALQAYYYDLPNNKSLAHQTNYLYRTMVNQVHNGNHAYGSEKRRRMDHADQNGNFRLLVESENQLGGAMYTDGAVNYDNMACAEFRDEEESRREFDFSVNQLLDKYKGKKNEVIIRVLTGRDDKKFTAFLHKRRYIRSKNKTSVDWLSQTDKDKYIKVFSEYLNVDSIRISNYLPKLCEQLGVVQ